MCILCENKDELLSSERGEKQNIPNYDNDTKLGFHKSEALIKVEKEILYVRITAVCGK